MKRDREEVKRFGLTSQTLSSLFRNVPVAEQSGTFYKAGKKRSDVGILRPVQG
jgi:hypothetical protein